MKDSNLIAAILFALAIAATFQPSPVLAGTSEEIVDDDESNGADKDGGSDCDGGAEECDG